MCVFHSTAEIRAYQRHVIDMRGAVLTLNIENLNGNISNAVVDVETTTASEIYSKPITWLLNPYLPIGTVTILLGDGGLGKSFVTLAIAAAISRGQLLPGMETSFPASDVIIQNAENSWQTVIKPRLEMLGADCTKIHSINDSDKRLTLTDERIEAAIRKHNAKYIVIDPIQSYLSENFSMNRAESVRPALMYLEHVAERTQAAVIIVGHISKGRGKAQHKGLGSVDIVNSVPSVLLLGRAEGLEPDERVISHLKGNFSELGMSQKFRLNKTDGFQWVGESDITPDDIINYNAKKEKEDKSKVEEAADFLSEILADGAIPTAEVIELAEESGIAKRTLERARKEIGVKSEKVDGVWTMKL
jgi:predicted ATP-dependent serine protease